MKNAIIFHGTGEKPSDYWYPYLKNKLEEKGYMVSIPVLPNADKPDIVNWLPKALEENYSKDTVVIGHSAGSTLILGLLDVLNIKIKQAIMVAAFYKNLPDFKEPIIKSSYNWERISENVEEIYVVNSDNDPWGCSVEVGLDLIGKIGGTLIVPHNQGHMGSESKKQPYCEFPLLLKLIE